MLSSVQHCNAEEWPGFEDVPVYGRRKARNSFSYGKLHKYPSLANTSFGSKRYPFGHLLNLFIPCQYQRLSYTRGLNKSTLNTRSNRKKVITQAVEQGYFIARWSTRS